MAVATKRQMNWSGVSFTPFGGSATTITGVTQVQIAVNGTLEKFAGDGDRYNTTVVNSMNDPMITVSTAHISVLLGLSVGTFGTFTATLNDAKNGTGTGAITYVVARAVIGDNSHGGSHRQFGAGTLQIGIESADGVTPPFATTIAP